MKNKTSKYEKILKILRYCGYFLVFSNIVLNILNIFSIAVFLIGRTWIILIFGFFLISLELIVLLIKIFAHKLKESITLRIFITIFIMIIISIIIGYIMFKNPMKLDNYTPDFGGLTGGVISGIATLIVVSHSLRIEQRKLIQKARISAGILHETLNSFYMQIRRIEQGSEEKLSYPKNWLDYYYDATYLTKFEYLKELNEEFNIIAQINDSIEHGDLNKARQLIKLRNKRMFNSLTAWNILEISANMMAVKRGYKEVIQWDRQEENLKIIKEIKGNYSLIIENYIYNYVLKKGTVELNSIEDNIIEWLKQNEFFKKIYDNRIIIKAILEICCDFNHRESRLDFTWNYLSIKSI